MKSFLNKFKIIYYVTFCVLFDIVNQYYLFIFQINMLPQYLKAFLVICGNDGTGKSSVTNQINQKFLRNQIDMFAFQRSNKPKQIELANIKNIISPKLVDDITFIYPFEQRPSLKWQIQYNNIKYPVYWIMLDAQIQTIQNRINKRMEMTIYETRKCLEYYQKVYRQIALNYGIPLIQTNSLGIEGVINKILQVIKNEYSFIHKLRLQNITYEKIQQNNLQFLIQNTLIKNNIGEVLSSNVFAQIQKNQLFTCSQISQIMQQNQNFKAKMLAKWLSKGNISQSQNKIRVSRQSISIQIQYEDFVFHLINQGESKKIFKILSKYSYYNSYVFIILKSTIYSHKNQATGIIQNLGKIRAKGSMLFLDLLNRNNINHSYLAINHNGIIISEQIQTVPVQLVFKKQFIGTDKHSYFNLESYKSVQNINQHQNYSSGIYVRFDWRNPNHITKKSGFNVSQNIFYYLIQEYFGKQTFFKKYLTNPELCKPYGDKCIYPELIQNIIDVKLCRQKIIKIYCVFRYYLNQINLQPIDGCFMIDKTGKKIWSQINPDCMRIKSSVQGDYDKDIWRIGGSSSKDLIVKKWSYFNELLSQYLINNRFHKTQLITYYQYPFQIVAGQILEEKHNKHLNYRQIYQSFIKPKRSRRCILTIDIFQQKPTLVKSSKVFEFHSNQNVLQAYQKIQIFDEILLVDLDGAFGNKQSSFKNRQLIKNISNRHRGCYTGGGIHTLEDVEQILNSGIKKVVISSNTNKQFLEKIPRDRIIVELSINESFQILIDGRKTNTKIHIIQKIKELIALNIQTISITFVCSQGHLSGIPRENIAKLLIQIPKPIKNIIIAGGISSIDDIKFLYRFDRVIPQLGSAIWKNKIKMAELLNYMINFDQHGLCPGIIQTTTGIIKGTVFFNKQSIQKCLETKLLHRYSRQHKKIMLKGEESKNYQIVSRISLNCNSDNLLIIVDDVFPFCHNLTYSCYNIQQYSLLQINNHIKQKIHGNSYSGIMQQNKNLALAKIFEEFWELYVADQAQQKKKESSDFLVHFMMYLNGDHIDLNEIIQQLQHRKNLIKITEGIKKNYKTYANQQIIIGILHEKYYEPLDQFILVELGIKLNRKSLINRNYKVQYEIINREKYQKYFGEKIVSFLPMKSKDIPWLLNFGAISHCITYSPVIENHPLKVVNLIQKNTQKFLIALIKPKDLEINIQSWTPQKKGIIACQHVTYVHKFLTQNLKLNPSNFSLIRVNGLSQSYIRNKSNIRFELCDAIVSSGRTLESNDLQIWKVIKQSNEIKMGFYKKI